MRIFISHASINSELAKKICEEFEKNDQTCWIAPRDINPTASYPEEIVNAIKSSDFIFLLLTHEASASLAVKREIELAFRNKKEIIIATPLERVSNDLEFFLIEKNQIKISNNPSQKEIEDTCRKALGSTESKKTSKSRFKSLGGIFQNDKMTTIAIQQQIKRIGTHPSDTNRKKAKKQLLCTLYIGGNNYCKSAMILSLFAVSIIWIPILPFLEKNKIPNAKWIFVIICLILYVSFKIIYSKLKLYRHMYEIIFLHTTQINYEKETSIFELSEKLDKNTQTTINEIRELRKLEFLTDIKIDKSGRIILSEQPLTKSKSDF